MDDIVLPLIKMGMSSNNPYALRWAIGYEGIPNLLIDRTKGYGWIDLCAY